MIRRELRKYFVFVMQAGILLVASSLALFAQGKNPVIFIPGLTGSELVHKVTGEKIWVKALRSDSEDLKLPISKDIARIHDDLIPGDIIRKLKIGILPSVDVYNSFVEAMELRGGYHEETWKSPSEDGYKDSLYVFPYDWRLDNVENARLLIRDIETLKLKLKKPNLKFDVVGHSMGGIIARYAAMYGDADLPVGNHKPVPTWAGAKDFDKVILLGTPNEGSANSLGSILSGFTVGGIRLDFPFLQDTSKFTVFTIPAAYQLMPAPGTLKVLDDHLQPLDIDVYDSKTWSKYGWNVMEDKGFTKVFDAAEQKIAPAFFAAALDRAKRLHEALAAANGKTGGVTFFTMGADCKQALNTIVIYRDEKNNRWNTLFKPKGFTNSEGHRYSDDDLKKVMMSDGDGVVTTRSLEASTESAAAGVSSILKSGSSKFVCEEHSRLTTNAKIQDYIIGILETKSSEAAETGN